MELLLSLPLLLLRGSMLVAISGRFLDTAAGHHYGGPFCVQFDRCYYDGRQNMTTPVEPVSSATIVHSTDLPGE